MKQLNCLKAYKAIIKFKDKEMPLKVSYALHKVKNLLQSQFDFQIAEEEKIFEKYKVSPDRNGNIQFSTEAEGAAFAKEFDKALTELSEMEVDLGEFKKSSISLKEAQNINMSIQDIEDLEAFIDFIE